MPSWRVRGISTTQPASRMTAWPVRAGPTFRVRAARTSPSSTTAPLARGRPGQGVLVDLGLLVRARGARGGPGRGLGEPHHLDRLHDDHAHVVPAAAVEGELDQVLAEGAHVPGDRKSTRLNSS